MVREEEAEQQEQVEGRPQGTAQEPRLSSSTKWHLDSGHAVQRYEHRTYGVARM